MAAKSRRLLTMNMIIITLIILILTCPILKAQEWDYPPNGTKISPGEGPKVVPMGKQDDVYKFLAVWTDQGELFGSIVTIGNPPETQNAVFPISNSNGIEDFAVATTTGGTACVVWEANSIIYCKVIQPDGEVSDPTKLSSTHSLSEDPVVSTTFQGIDGNTPNSGSPEYFTIAWKEPQSSVKDNLKVQKIDSSGSPQWGVNGKTISDSSSGKEELTLSSDLMGGVIASWVDERNGNENIFGARIDNNGNPVYETKISDVTADQESSPQIIAYKDFTDNNNFIFAVIWTAKNQQNEYALKAIRRKVSDGSTTSQPANITGGYRPDAILSPSAAYERAGDANYLHVLFERHMRTTDVCHVMSLKYYINLNGEFINITNFDTSIGQANSSDPSFHAFPQWTIVEKPGSPPLLYIVYQNKDDSSIHIVKKKASNGEVLYNEQIIQSQTPVLSAQIAIAGGDTGQPGDPSQQGLSSKGIVLCQDENRNILAAALNIEDNLESEFFGTEPSRPDGSATTTPPWISLTFTVSLIAEGYRIERRHESETEFTLLTEKEGNGELTFLDGNAEVGVNYYRIEAYADVNREKKYSAPTALQANFSMTTGGGLSNGSSSNPQHSGGNSDAPASSLELFIPGANGNSGTRCYIATSTYRAPYSDNIFALTAFRRYYLKGTSSGLAASFAYSKLAPSPAINAVNRGIKRPLEMITNFTKSLLLQWLVFSVLSLALFARLRTLTTNGYMTYKTLQHCIRCVW